MMDRRYEGFEQRELELEEEEYLKHCNAGTEYYRARRQECRMATGRIVDKIQTRGTLQHYNGNAYNDCSAGSSNNVRITDLLKRNVQVDSSRWDHHREIMKRHSYEAKRVIMNVADTAMHVCLNEVQRDCGELLFQLETCGLYDHEPGILAHMVLPGKYKTPQSFRNAIELALSDAHAELDYCRRVYCAVAIKTIGINLSYKTSGSIVITSEKLAVEVNPDNYIRVSDSTKRVISRLRKDLNFIKLMSDNIKRAMIEVFPEDCRVPDVRYYDLIGIDKYISNRSVMDRNFYTTKLTFDTGHTSQCTLKDAMQYLEWFRSHILALNIYGLNVTHDPDMIKSAVWHAKTYIKYRHIVEITIQWKAGFIPGNLNLSYNRLKKSFSNMVTLAQQGKYFASDNLFIEMITNKNACHKSFVKNANRVINKANAVISKTKFDDDEYFVMWLCKGYSSGKEQEVEEHVRCFDEFNIQLPDIVNHLKYMYTQCNMDNVTYHNIRTRLSAYTIDVVNENIEYIREACAGHYGFASEVTLSECGRYLNWAYYNRKCVKTIIINDVQYETTPTGFVEIAAHISELDKQRRVRWSNMISTPISHKVAPTISFRMVFNELIDENNPPYYPAK